MFDGQAQRMRVVSNNISYGPPPEATEEVEQHITINAKGQVWFSAFNFGTEPEKYLKARSQYLRIECEKARKLLNATATYFGNNYEELFATDVGDWTLELTNSEGKQFRYKGSLCVQISVGGMDLSDMLRNETGLYDLFAFDGNY